MHCNSQNTIVKNHNVPHGAYFVTDDSSAILCTPKLSKLLSCTWSNIYTWTDLVAELQSGTRFVVTHATTLKEHFDDCPEKFVEVVESIVKCVHNHPGINVVVIINPTITQEYIRRLQKSKVMGILLGMNFWSPEECIAGVSAITSGKPYWPENIISQLPVESVSTLPNIVYYNDDHSKSPKCTKALSEINGATWTLPSTWQELTREIEQGEDKIVFHIDMIVKSVESIKSFINSLRTIVKFIPGHNPLKIIVLITPTTTQQQIKELKDAKILGIGYDVTYYSFEQAAEATTALIAGNSYWPEHIISQLPKKSVSTLPRVVSLRITQHDLSKKIKQLVIDNPYYDINFCYSWDSFTELLSKPTDLVLFHCKILDVPGINCFKIVDMISSITKFSAGKSIKIAAIIDPDTTQERIKELHRLGVNGVVPNAEYWPLEIVFQKVVAALNNESYWPKDIIGQLPSSSQIKDENYLTPRQEEISNMIALRGISNKQVAKNLGISESTVKMHLSKIFKKHRVTTRAQLARSILENR
jgi:DNA-binding NarL/FixJ family response regulator